MTVTGGPEVGRWLGPIGGKRGEDSEVVSSHLFDLSISGVYICSLGSMSLTLLTRSKCVRPDSTRSTVFLTKS